MRRDAFIEAALKPCAPRYTLRQAVYACAGVFVVIAIIGVFSFELGVLLALGSFGSSSVLLFAFPENHFSQPRSIAGGHVVCSAVGLLAWHVCGPHWWAMAGAVAVATALMMGLRCMHPPAGSNPLIVFLGLHDWDMLLFPTLSGSIALVLVALAYHRIQGRNYPLYWR